jgi:diguanylate cyclase (GGDEF)-like protein
MRLRLVHGFIVAVLLLPLACKATDYESLLREADRARSSEPRHFLKLLEELKSGSEGADPKQREHLQYLDAYRLVVYANSVNEGIAQAKDLFQRTKDTDLKFRAGSFIANSLAINRDFTEGLRYLNQTLEMRHQVKDRTIRDDGVNAAAAIYNQLGQYGLGLKYSQETLSAEPSSRAACFANLFRVEALFYLKRLPQDQSEISPVIDQCVALGENIPANFTRAIMARHLARQGKHSEAVDLLQSHMAEVDGLGYARLIAEFRSLLAELNLKDGDQEAATEHAEAALEQASQVVSSQPLAVAYRVLYETALQRGDSATALARYRQYAETDKAWLNEVKARELAYQIVHQETSQQTQQIELLNKQNELLQLQQQVQVQNAQNTRLLVLLLLLLLTSIGFWAYKTKRVQMSLRRMAETDALTGICNRHHFTQQSELALAQCARAGEDVALVMFDLDHFKSINDRYGHDTGDWVLKQVVAVCAPVCRQIDYFGRIGGEEFAILLIGIDARGAKRLAEDCRVRIAGIDSGDSGYRFKPGASFGVTTTALSGYDLAKMLSHADKMLYRAKRGGRNRVFVYEVPVPVQLPVPVGTAHDEPEPVVESTMIETVEVAEDQSPRTAATAVS